MNAPFSNDRPGLIPKPMPGRLRWVTRSSFAGTVRVLQQMFLIEYRERLDGWPVDAKVEWRDVPTEEENPA